MRVLLYFLTFEHVPDAGDGAAVLVLGRELLPEVVEAVVVVGEGRDVLALRFGEEDLKGRKCGHAT